MQRLLCSFGNQIMEKSKVHFLESNWSVLNQVIEEKSYSQVFMLVDSNTMHFCLPIIQSELNQEFQIIEVDPGEGSKDLEICQGIWHELTAQSADRKTLILNLGGGVVCDLGGFVASIYKRGIDFINIPTSLLAMVDASVGGKCGIDFLGFKNQLGAFNEATHCFIDSVFLNTLPKVDLKSGLAEMLKHGLIEDKVHWSNLIKNVNLNLGKIKSLIKTSVGIKQEIVKIDPKEIGVRKKLNFGHTIGHAIESHFLKGGSPIPHGFSIAAGIISESYISHKVSNLSIEELLEISIEIKSRYSMLEISNEDFPSIIKFIAQDKKNEQNENRFTLLNGIGESIVGQSVENDLIIESLHFYIASYED
jgi:3-dehydroquinate synthase